MDLSLPSVQYLNLHHKVMQSILSQEECTALLISDAVMLYS